MPKHIDQQRTELLKRRNEIIGLVDHEDELEDVDAALKLLDEIAARGDTRTYPRLKVRKMPEGMTENGRRWVITERAATDDDVERVLAWQADLPAAHGSATKYVEVQRTLAEKLGDVFGWGAL